jgi:hypothetical protein
MNSQKVILPNLQTRQSLDNLFTNRKMTFNDLNNLTYEDLKDNGFDPYDMIGEPSRL